MRLDKYLADMSVGTRSQVREIIKDGRIKVNNQIIKKADFKVNDNDEVLFDEKPVSYVEYEYYLLNKPAGYLCAKEDKKIPVVMELITSRRKDLVPIGRLDKDTEGLLLISNDGQLNHRLLNAPQVYKTYYVETLKSIREDAEKVFEAGISFQEFISHPAKLERLADKRALLTINEGKFHQVKRMFKHIDNEVVFLKRLRFGTLELGDLPTGQYRELTAREVEELWKLVK